MKYIKAGIIKYIKGNEIFDRFLKIFSVDVLVKASGFLLFPVYLSFMTQSEYGLYSYLVAAIGTISLVLNFGLYIAQSKLYHVYTGKERRKLLFTLNVLLFFLLTISIGILYFSGYDYSLINYLIKSNIDYSSYRNLLFLGILVSIYSFMLYNFYMTSEKIQIVQKYNVLRLIIVNGVVLYMLYQKSSDSVLIRIQYAYVAELAIDLIFYAGYIKEMYFEFDIKMAIRCMKIAFPIFFGAIIGIFSGFSDKYILEKYVGMDDMGIYSLGNTMAGILFTIFSSFNNIWLPFFFKEKDFEKNLKRTRKMCLTLGAVFIVLGLALMATLFGFISIGLISNKYSSVFEIMPYLIIANILSMMSQMYGVYLIYLEKPVIQITINVFYAAIVVLLNTFFISNYKLMGAAISVMLSAGISFILYVSFVYFTKNKVK